MHVHFGRPCMSIYSIVSSANSLTMWRQVGVHNYGKNTFSANVLAKKYILFVLTQRRSVNFVRVLTIPLLVATSISLPVR